MLRKYEAWLHQHDLKGNSKSNYFRTLRATYNRAIGDGVADASMYPFKNMLNPRGFQISRMETKTIKRAISADELKKVIEYPTKPLTRLHDAKMYFLFMLITRGMNFTDLSHLTKANIINKQLVYTRAKTRHTQQAIIEILPQMAEIIEYFKTHPETTDHLFPILNSKAHTDEKKIKDRIRTRLKRINKQLKSLSELAGVSVKITTYTARHSWATLAKMTGESESLISEGLLHDNVKTTQIYLMQFENKLINEMNKRIVDNIYKQ
jgi:integrase